jgi:hypothetical protein
MILNEAQQQELQKELNYAVKYQETYDEVYDHILTALENKSDIRDLKTEVDEMINNDFGGAKGILNMEKAGVKMLKQNIRRQYLLQFEQFCKWPGILFTALLIVLAYININLFGSTLIGACIFMVVVVLPWCYLVIRNFMIGLKQGRSKRSIINKVMCRLAGLPFGTYMLAKFVLFLFKIQMETYVEHGFFVFLIIHVVVYYKISTKVLVIKTMTAF